ncbi:MAG: hypothetical protein ABIX12_08450 [Rubrivivax sp.]
MSPIRPLHHAPHRLAALVALSLVAVAPVAAAQNAPGASSGSMIYSCVDAHGRRMTSDRLIAECMGQEQRILNRDGSLRMVVPAALTPDERAAKDLRDRREAEQRAARAEALRRDRHLIARFPDETTHQRAREAALDTVREAMRTSAQRVSELEAERKPMLTESEFYAGRTLPTPLRAQLDGNEASMQAQRQATKTQEAELDRINKLYDVELGRLKRLWAGAEPGSLGSVASAANDAKARRP